MSIFKIIKLDVTGRLIIIAHYIISLYLWDCETVII